MAREWAGITNTRRGVDSLLPLFSLLFGSAMFFHTAFQNGALIIEFFPDNPGKWFHHCHNLYHMMAGMANVVEYQS
jgi:FtsP/CotA-like multicopper oxidase with cupredoxin domain